MVEVPSSPLVPSLQIMPLMPIILYNLHCIVCSLCFNTSLLNEPWYLIFFNTKQCNMQSICDNVIFQFIAIKKG